MAVTIKDIARIANVSHTTVSRALNDSPVINQETKDKIKSIARKLNYSPNFSAKSLVTHKSYNIGLFFSTINEGTTSSFFHEVIKGVDSIIKDKYNLVVKGIDDYSEYSFVSKKGFDGIIVMSQSEKDDAFIYSCLEKEIPLIVLNREIEDESIINILSDDRRGAYGAVEYLINQGHKDIAIIEGIQGFKSSKERKSGYLDAIIYNGLKPNEDYFISGKYNLESGYLGMNRLLDMDRIPTAVFCSNDDMAVGAIKAILERGLKVPEDVSVAGFDDSMFAAFISPSLTTVKRPIESISREGTCRLLKVIEEGKKVNQPIYLNTELIIRESVTKRIFK